MLLQVKYKNNELIMYTFTNVAIIMIIITLMTFEMGGLLYKTDTGYGPNFQSKGPFGDAKAKQKKKKKRGVFR